MGWGLLMWRILKIKPPTYFSTLTVWLGYCVVLGTLEIIHLLVAIDWKITTAVVILGLIGHAVRYGSSALLLKQDLALGWHSLCQHPIAISVLALVVIFWSLRAMTTPLMYDSGLYHFGVIRWLNEYPIVPGVGNLHWRLALNQSYFFFSALLNIDPFWDKGYAAASLFLLSLTALTVSELVVSFVQSKAWRWFFWGLLFSYLSLLSRLIANPLPDTAISLLEIIIFLLLYRNLVETTLCPTERQRTGVLLAFLCLTIVTIKLSSMAFALGSLILVLIDLLRRRCDPDLLNLVAKILAILLIFTFVHLGRGYLMSGAPLFPSPIGGLWSLPWSVDAGMAQNESNLIYAWAKQPGVTSPGEVNSSFSWFPAWFAGLPSTVWFMFVSGTGMLLTVCLVSLKYKQSTEIKNIRLLGIPILMGLSFWFFTAPDVRFLGAVITLYFVWALMMMTVCVRPIIESTQRQYFLSSRFIIIAAVFLTLTLFIRWSIVDVLPSVGWEPVPLAEVEVQVNRTGAAVFVPKGSAQCWSASLPCAVVLHDGLKSNAFAVPSLWSYTPQLRLWFSTK